MSLKGMISARARVQLSIFGTVSTLLALHGKG